MNLSLLSCKLNFKSFSSDRSGVMNWRKFYFNDFKEYSILNEQFSSNTKNKIKFFFYSLISDLSTWHSPLYFSVLFRITSILKNLKSILFIFFKLWLNSTGPNEIIVLGDPSFSFSFLSFKLRHRYHRN